MKSAYEAWVDSFQFTEDLKALEEIYQDEHQEALKRQMNASSRKEPPPQPLQSRDEPFLAHLSEKIAHRLSDYLSSSEAFSEYLKLSELERDNAIMARQIQELLARVKVLETENRALLEREARYFHLLGRLYLKNE